MDVWYILCIQMIYKFIFFIFLSFFSSIFQSYTFLISYSIFCWMSFLYCSTWSLFVNYYSKCYFAIFTSRFFYSIFFFFLVFYDGTASPSILTPSYTTIACADSLLFALFFYTNLYILSSIVSFYLGTALKTYRFLTCSSSSLITFHIPLLMI